MQTTIIQRGDRGIALLVAVFSLLLLSVIGLGMMYGTNMESAINRNYRDKQTTMYAAMAGLQEARDRLQPATLTITPPTVLPSLSAAGVIYLINPKTGETVAPWLYSNPYADTELCHENILSLSGTSGIRCSGSGSLPSISNTLWRTVHNDSTTTTGPAAVWKLSNPLDFKWVRITFKKNNMVPYSATGTSGTNQVCWDGRYQVMLPDGYGTECVRIGSVVVVSVTSPGANYTSQPTVTIDAPPGGGVQATASANMVPTSTSSVLSVAVYNGGSGFNSAPNVIFMPVDGNGSGAVATATIVPPGKPVASVMLDTPGTACYAVAPAVSFSGGGGSGATGTATLAGMNSCIAAWNVSGNCPGKKGDTVSSIGLTGATGSGFSGRLSFGATDGHVTSITVQNPGNGYTTNPTGFSGLGGCGGLTFTTVLGKRVASVSGSGGSGYTTVPTVVFGAGTGTPPSPPTATATLGTPPANAGQVVAINVTNGGTGYTAPPNVQVAGGGGTGVVATATLAGVPMFKVDSVSVTNPGYGYTTDPMVSFGSGGGGSGAAATAMLGGGSNYGKVYLVTALAQTKTGGRSMLQMEVASPVTGSGSAAALVIDGPNPNMDAMPNSDEFYIDGHDGNSCTQAPEPVHPAIGGYDDPNADPPTNSVRTIIDALPRSDHYIGEGDAPSVYNVYSSLGETMGTPMGLRTYIDKEAEKAVNVGNNIVLGSAAAPAINYVEGNAVLNGNNTGYGLLVVTGKLTMSGDFHWHGAVLVVGDGELDFSGGGSGTIVGTVIVAKIWDSYMTKNPLATMGSPTVHWNGGGNNGIYYDHCWATNMMAMVPIIPPTSTQPLRVLSLRSLPY